MALVRESCAPVYAIVAELSGFFTIRLVYRVLLSVPAGTVAADAGFHKSGVPVQDLFCGVHVLLPGGGSPKPDDGADEHQHLTSALSVSNWKRKIEGSLPLGQAGVKTLALSLQLPAVL